MNRALVLAGGGARGAYQVGMLQELVVERQFDFQVIRGVSVGALNAAFLAQAPASAVTASRLASGRSENVPIGSLGLRPEESRPRGRLQRA